MEKYRTKVDTYSSHQLLKTLILKSLYSEPKIIDFGCYRGELLVSLSKSLPGSTLFGADIEDFVTQMNSNIKFFKLNLNDHNQLRQLIGYQFDIIILADILEHILNPEVILKEMQSFRNIKSNIFLSIPNSGHWYFRFKVLCGKFDYQENGLFDKTHIRFFTIKTIEQLINNCNLKIVDLEYSSIPWENIKLPKIISKTFGKIERILIKIRPQLFAYQVICKLK